MLSRSIFRITTASPLLLYRVSARRLTTAPAYDPALAQLEPHLKRVVLARITESNPAALLRRWRRAYTILEKRRRANIELAERSLDDAVQRMRDAETAAAIPSVAVVSRYGGIAEQQQSEEKENTTARLRAAATVRRAEQRFVRVRRSAGVPQRRILARNVSRLCRSAVFAKWLERRRRDALDPLFIAALNDLSFFKAAWIRQRHVTAVTTKQTALSPKGTPQGVDEKRSPRRRRRRDDAAVINRPFLTQTVLLTLAGVVAGALQPHHQNDSDLATATVTPNTTNTRRPVASPSNMVTLLWAAGRLELPLDTATVSAAMSTIIGGLTTLSAKGLLSFLVWCCQSPLSDRIVQRDDLEALRARVVTVILHGPPEAIQGSDAAHCLVGLARLDEKIADHRAHSDGSDTRRTTTNRVHAALSQPSVRYALLRRMVGGRLAMPLSEQEASLKHVLRNDVVRGIKIARERAEERREQGQKPRQPLREKSEALIHAADERYHFKLIRIRSAYEEEARRIRDEVLVPLAPAALLAIVTTLGQHLVQSSRAPRSHGGGLPSEPHRHADALATALALQALNVQLKHDTHGGETSQELPSRLLLLAAATLADSPSLLDKSTSRGTLSVLMLSDALAEAIDASLLSMAAFLETAAPSGSSHAPLLQMVDPAGVAATVAARGLAGIGQLHELGFFGGNSVDGASHRCRSRAFGLITGTAKQRSSIRELALKLVRVMVAAVEANVSRPPEQLLASGALELTLREPLRIMALDGLRALGMDTPTMHLLLSSHQPHLHHGPSAARPRAPSAAFRRHAVAAEESVRRPHTHPSTRHVR